MKNRLYFVSDHPKAQAHALDAISKELDHVGYYALPDREIRPLLEYAKQIPEKIESIVIIGIGGSALGAKAVYEFLQPAQELKRRLYTFESTDPIDIKATLRQIDLDTTHFIVISKSGTTIETFSIYKYVYSLHPDMASYTFITDPGSALERYANERGAPVLHIPENVGGRFSVLSAVGLVPLALCGVDITALLEGAKQVKESFFKQGYIQETLLKKAVFYAKNHARYNINCLFAYSETLKYFCEWYVQLWGESLGKHQRNSAFHVGLTPIGLIGPKDQHSFLQLLTDGTRDKSVTFIKIENFEDGIHIPDVSLPHLESLDILNDLSFNALINLQCDSVLESLDNEGGIPLDSITLPKIDERSIGSLIYYYELLTSLVAELMDVNAYDQPGVEDGKDILKKKLKKLTNDKKGREND
ncbi:MAG: glucose-6-phosphate isomerase [Sulfurimonas sp.]